MDEATEQPRTPGVKYRKVTRHREETTVIDGVPSTRNVAYDAWEPVPPREWDEMILRGATGVIVGVTGMAIVATTASLGGLLSAIVPDVVAYGAGGLFTAAWVTAMAFEWLDRIDPERGKAARIAGWCFLLLSMGAVFTYGFTLNQPWAGGFGACIDLLSKGLWALLIRHHAVPLDEGVAHWVTQQEQKLASRELLSGRLLRLNRRAAYQRAVGGVEYQAAGAILASAQTTSLPPAEQTPEPAPSAPVPPAAGEGGDEQKAPVPTVTEIDRQSIAAIVREVIAHNPKVSDAELVTAVKEAGHPDRPNLADTVRRTALRVDPSRKAS
ncbi:hypothetical protein OG763_15060 [Streptomyces sp. NBC_01230]|uniref:hypothetical protein n=1 Tax=Streptomyces sp. NBC_01230 TaxID=2903784 RepID=UPI002E0D8327|nr:hypothetical protein OG763_15060 [Streptomyces sp. NBC_01230]